jgi:hypothetical protein
VEPLGRHDVGDEKMRSSLQNFRYRNAPSVVRRMIAIVSYILTIVSTVLLSTSVARSAAYGCYVAGNWACYPTPQICYDHGSGPVQSYPTSSACREPTKASGKRVKKR